MTMLRAVKGRAAGIRAGLTVVPVQDATLATGLRPFGRAVANVLTGRAREADFRGRAEDALVHQGDRGTMLVLGLGDGAGSIDAWRRVGARAPRGRTGRRETCRRVARRVRRTVRCARGRAGGVPLRRLSLRPLPLGEPRVQRRVVGAGERRHAEAGRHPPGARWRHGPRDRGVRRARPRERAAVGRDAALPR